MDIKLRDFHYQDLPAAIQLMKDSFAEDFKLQGLTIEALAFQLRQITRGRMIPFRILSALAGVKWAILVAEANGQIIGIVAYLGTAKQVTINNFMVMPAHRRRGIGKILLKAGLERLKQQRCPVAATWVLEHNLASCKSFIGQGFKVYAYLVEFDLPLMQLRSAQPVIGRPPQLTDRPSLEQLERKVLGEKIIRFSGSDIRKFYPGLAARLQLWLSGAQVWVRVFESEGQIVGFVRTYVRNQATKGIVPTLVIDSSSPSLRLSIMREAAEWCARVNPAVEAIRITVRSEIRPALSPDIVEHASEMTTFLEFYKSL